MIQELSTENHSPEVPKLTPAVQQKELPKLPSLPSIVPEKTATMHPSSNISYLSYHPTPVQNQYLFTPTTQQRFFIPQYSNFTEVTMCAKCSQCLRYPAGAEIISCPKCGSLTVCDRKYLQSLITNQTLIKPVYYTPSMLKDSSTSATSTSVALPKPLSFLPSATTPSTITTPPPLLETKLKRDTVTASFPTVVDLTQPTPPAKKPKEDSSS